MIWLEIKYISHIKSQLDLFTPITNEPFVVNFRCPFCHDSQRSNKKKRAYIYEKDKHLKFFCHNCGSSQTFYTFLENINSFIFNQFKLERIKTNKNSKINGEEENKFRTSFSFEKKLILSTNNKINLGKPLIELPNTNDVVKYVNERKIPRKYWNSLYGCNNFQEITSQIERYEELKLKTPVLLIPFFTPEKNFSYINVRNIQVDNINSWRYILLKIDDIFPKIWGLNFIDWKKPLFVFEGPIDAMCFENSISLGGSQNSSEIKYIMNNINNYHDVIFIYDNEIFKNKQILNQIKKRIKEKFSVVIYDRNFTSKDINDALLNNITFNQLNLYIKNRIFNGLKAQLELSRLSNPKNRL